MKIGEEVLIHGYIDEIRKDIVIIRNEGGYFGAVPEEIRSSSEIPNTCGDAISRQSAIFLASDLKQDLPDDERIADMVMAHNEGILEYQTQLSLLPPVSPQQRTGRWKFIVYDANRIGHYECTECHWNVLMNVSDYCPHCGAKMEVKE
jgi:hypothetical protein